MKIHGVHHFGITVPNIADAMTFFEKAFGAVRVFNTGPFDVDDKFMSGKLGAAPQSRIKDLVMMRVGNGTTIEFFEYSGDNAARTLRSSEPGGMHLAFEVDDVHKSLPELKALGVEILDGPNTNEGGPLDGLTWIYFRTPWGLMLEILSYKKLGYEADTKARLYDPKVGS